MVIRRSRRWWHGGGFVQESRQDKVFLVVIGSVLLGVLLVVLYPLIYIVSSSFSSSTAVITGQVWLLPVQPTTMGYEAVFTHSTILSGFANSIFYTVVGTTVNVVMMIPVFKSEKQHFGGEG